MIGSASSVSAEPPVRVRCDPEIVDSPVAHPRECCRHVWRDWFVRHGVNPADVLVDSPSACSGFVFRDVDGFRIRFMPLEPRPGLQIGESIEFQLDGPPLPFQLCNRNHEQGEF